MSRSQLTRRIDALEASQPERRIWVVYPDAQETTAEALARAGIAPQPHDMVIVVLYEDGGDA
jgi:hypothetical protein